MSTPLFGDDAHSYRYVIRGLGNVVGRSDFGSEVEIWRGDDVAEASAQLEKAKTNIAIRDPVLIDRSL